MCRSSIWRSGSRTNVGGLASPRSSAVSRINCGLKLRMPISDRRLIDEAQLRQEPTDRDIGANKEATDPKGIPQKEAGTKMKSEARNNQGFKVGDEGRMHDLAAGKQP